MVYSRNSINEAMLDLGFILRRHSHHLQLSEAQAQEEVRLVMIGCMAVGVGLRLGPHLRSHASLKIVANTIQLADGFMKGAATIHKLRFPTPANMLSLALESAKAVAWGGSKALVLNDKNACFKKIYKGLRASEGALNVVKCSGVLNHHAADPLECVIKGYRLTKSAFDVMDGVHGVMSETAAGYGGIKVRMEGVGVVVKGMVLYQQMHGFLIRGLRISHELWEEKMQQRRGLQGGNPFGYSDKKTLGERYL